jgi:hypothetical protein
VQLTTHGTSGGQVTPALHSLLLLQSNVHVPLAQVPPAFVQLVPHSATDGVSSGASTTSGGGPSVSGPSVPAAGAL